ncbi:hypothetical protein ACQCSX_14150 [Pseudarthrobacter sp. P1]|uniref:hypothetical protein n=1 Tax=Pseudarthrobacter sp. P1 TaxID=3418418 RepID=UPI003CFAEA24
MGSRKRQHAKPAAAKPPVEEPATAPLRMAPQRLAAWLLDPDRTDVVVVVSHWPEHPEAHADAAQIAAKLDGIAKVALVISGRETLTLEAALTKMSGIFNNAVRAYGPGTAWLKDPYNSPLHIIHSAAELESAATKVVHDAEDLAAAAQWNSRSAPAQAPAPSVQALGTIKQPSSDGLVAFALLGQGMAVVHKAHHLPDVPLNWLLADGQQVHGLHHRSDNSFHIPLAHAPVSVNRTYPSGAVALALVTAVRPDRATVMLYPGHSMDIPLHLITSNDIDTADDLLSVGEVVAVRVAREQGRVVLSMLDVDDDEDIVPPPALLVGGTPWLELGRNLYDDDPAVDGGAALQSATSPAAGAAGTEDPLSAGPLPAAGGPGSVAAPPPQPTAAPAAGALPQALLRVDALKAENGVLKTEATGLRDEIGHLRRQLANGTAGQAQLAKLGAKLEAEREEAREFAAELNDAQGQVREMQRKLRDAEGKLRELKTKNRNASKSVGKQSIRASRDWFATNEEYVRFAVAQAWARYVPAEDKAEFPLHGYRVGPDFHGSLAATPEDKRGKALRAVVDLVANRAEALRKREAHPLRIGNASSAPVITRVRDGSTDSCWRLYVEEKSSAARRLHYWKCADGTIELSRIVTHEDMEP